MIDADRAYTDSELYLLDDDDLRDLAREAYRRLAQEETRHITGYDRAHLSSMASQKHLIELTHRATAELNSRRTPA